jgi:DNA-binding NarL/FixJ family response regulator
MVKTEILLVDDHPITLDSYISILSNTTNITQPINFTAANSCNEAYLKIMKADHSHLPFEIAFLDISLPPFKEKYLLSGIDLALLIRNCFPTCKIIFVTMHCEPLLVYKAIKKINPEGFIMKNDINAKSFMEAYRTIVYGNHYYSQTINKYQNESTLKKLHFDIIDCQILLLISRGIKTKAMTKHLDLSLSAIEKRKACIKNTLLKEKGSDRELLVEAKKMRLI